MDTDLHKHLAALATEYFRAMDQKDLDGLLALFADDATVLVLTDGTASEGAGEIRRTFGAFFETSESIDHRISKFVIDESAGTFATVQNYVGDQMDGSHNDMHNCNFFDVDPDGRITRVLIWTGGRSALQ